MSDYLDIEQDYLDIEQEISEKLKQSLLEKGIKIAVGGKRGFGKSSTLNALFGLNLDVHPVLPTTLDVHPIPIKENLSEHEVDGVRLTVYDMPGLGEGVNKNTEKYMNSYLRVFKEADVILWVLRADVAAFQSDIDYISKLVKKNRDLKSRIVIGLNRADAIEPLNWQYRINEPSKSQYENLELMREQVLELVHDQCELDSNVVTFYSAKRMWSIELLFNYLINACPSDIGKRWTFARLRQNYLEEHLKNVAPEFQAEVRGEYLATT